MEQYGIQQLFSLYPEKYVVCAVATRNKDGVAEKYHLIKACDLLEMAQENCDNEEYVIIPTFYGDDESAFMSPSDYAKFVRSHFGFDRLHK